MFYLLYVSYHQISISGEFLWNIHHCTRTGRRSLFERRREEILEKALFSFTSFWNLLCPQRKNKGQKEKKKHPFAKRHFMNMKLKRSLCGHLKILSLDRETHVTTRFIQIHGLSRQNYRNPSESFHWKMKNFIHFKVRFQKLRPKPFFRDEFVSLPTDFWGLFLLYLVVVTIKLLLTGIIEVLEGLIDFHLDFSLYNLNI